jgi:hypothetical protein
MPWTKDWISPEQMDASDQLSAASFQLSGEDILLKADIEALPVEARKTRNC